MTHDTKLWLATIVITGIIAGIMTIYAYLKYRYPKAGHDGSDGLIL